MINHVADNTADKITQILQQGSAQLEQVKRENEKKTGKSKAKIEEQEWEAERMMDEAKEKIKESEKQLKVIKKEIKDH